MHAHTQAHTLTPLAGQRALQVRSLSEQCAARVRDAAHPKPTQESPSAHPHPPPPGLLFPEIRVSVSLYPISSYALK